MFGVNETLLAWFVGSAVFLIAVEAYCVKTAKPTISERIQALGRSAPLVAVIVSCFVGMMLIHFFG